MEDHAVRSLLRRIEVLLALAAQARSSYEAAQERRRQRRRVLTGSAEIWPEKQDQWLGGGNSSSVVGSEAEGDEEDDPGAEGKSGQDSDGKVN